MNSTKARGKQQWLINLSCLCLLFMFTNSYAVVNAYDKPVNHPPIPLLDEQGKHVLESNNPYSPKKSCEGSGCHDYEAITHAYHFEMGRDEADDSYGLKRGLPHLVSPGYFGGYTCMGGDTPNVLAKKDNSANPEDFADLGAAGWVKNCMSCHTGGGWAEKDRDGIRYDEKNMADIKQYDGDYYERHTMPNGESHLMMHDWKKSGVGEADCMVCHADVTMLKTPEDSGLEVMLSPRKARQAFTTEGFFRQAASGLLENVVDKDGKSLMTVARAIQPNPGMHGQPGVGESLQPVLDDKGMPKFNWHADAFDENGRATIPMLRFPANENCMICHSTSNSRRGFYGFGDAASAVLLVKGLEEAFYFFDTHSMPWGDYLGYIGKAEDGSGFYHDGNNVHKFVGRIIAPAIIKTFEQAGIDPADIDHFVPHQPSGKTLDLLYKKLCGLFNFWDGKGQRPDDQCLFHNQVANTGNLSSVSTIWLISKAIQDGTIRYNDKILVSAFGSGMSCCTYAFRNVIGMT